MKLESNHLENQLLEAEVAFQANHTNKAWKLVNTITNRKSTASGKTKGKSPEDRTQQWYKHFKDLLGTPAAAINPVTVITQPVFSKINIPDTPFTIEEIREAKKQVREDKAPGEDGIMPEVLKRCDIDGILQCFSNKLFVDGVKPDEHNANTKIMRSI